VLPALGVALNLLSGGAAYGLLVLVFQHGIGASLLGFQKVDTLEAWLPLFLFSVLFGLSMDYQVFCSAASRSATATAATMGGGACSQVRPSRSRPPALGVRPPHCPVDCTTYVRPWRPSRPDRGGAGSR